MRSGRGYGKQNLEVAHVENILTGGRPQGTWLFSTLDARRNVVVTPITGVNSLRPRHLGPEKTGLHFPSCSGLQISRDPRARGGVFPRGTTDDYRRRWTAPCTSCSRPQPEDRGENTRVEQAVCIEIGCGECGDVGCSQATLGSPQLFPLGPEHLTLPL